MNEDQARPIVLGLRTEYEEQRQIVAEAQHRMNALRKLIEGYTELFPALAPPSPIRETIDALRDIVTQEDRPKGQEAALKVMEESIGKWFTVMAMTRELTERGWLPAGSDSPANAVRAALDRLVAMPESNVVKDRGKHGNVTYSLRPVPIQALPAAPAAGGD